MESKLKDKIELNQQVVKWFFSAMNMVTTKCIIDVNECFLKFSHSIFIAIENAMSRKLDNIYNIW